MDKNVYCTLFDSNYLDKGLVLIKSLEKNAKKFRLYVLAMDDRCEKVLKDIDFENVIVVSLCDFEDEVMLKVKSNRSRAEYNWTCSACFLDYVFTVYNEGYCTYIDADMYFYCDPIVLINEMIANNKSVQIIEHRFSNSFYGYYSEKNSGKYCVEFNTFCNDTFGRKVLKEWKKQVLNSCKAADNGKTFGDQMYLNEWLEKYDCVHVLEHPGAGLALWNLDRYKLISKNDDDIQIKMDDKVSTNVVFYHYHNICYLNEKTVDIGVAASHWRVDHKLVKALYNEYLLKLNHEKEFVLKEYGFYPMIIKHPALSEEIEPVNLSLKDKIYNYSVDLDRRIKKYLNGKKDIIHIG
ncbi:hypothetical protein [Butyrivibrio sp. NC3005]|uniref:hypothetical protein n=1 Tax=Butyrivibrio sp. NC3005 TaxID=1280685 RepID=UPI000687FACB|nr:hypothetical protein [Butyrivibrio sp. NC3005]